MFPIAKGQDLDPAMVELFIKMRGNIDRLYLLSYGKQLAKTQFYLFVSKVNAKAAAMVALV